MYKGKIFLSSVKSVESTCLFWRLIWDLIWIYHHKYLFYSWVTYEIWFSNFTPEHFLFIHRGKESSTGISKNIENLFLEKPWSALTPFTYRQNLVHEIIVSNASPDFQLRPQNKVKLDIFRYFSSSASLLWGQNKLFVYVKFSILNHLRLKNI